MEPLLVKPFFFSFNEPRYSQLMVVKGVVGGICRIWVGALNGQLIFRLLCPLVLFFEDKCIQVGEDWL